MKKDLEGLFREAERLQPPPGLWRRIAERSPLALANAPWGGLIELPLLRAAAVTLAAGLLAWAAFGLSRRPVQEPVREAAADVSAEASVSAGDTGIFDPELLGWQAGLGTIDSEADEAGEML